MTKKPKTEKPGTGAAAKKKKSGGARRQASDQQVRDRADILAAALPHVAFDGWSLKVMREAAEAAGLDHGRMRLAFPDGVVDLVDYFCADGDRRMRERLAEKNLSKMKVRDRILLAVRTRIDVNAEHREAVRRAGTFMALPFHGALAARALYRTVDAMWRAVGDISTDFNFYTKRALLAGVYTATLLFWLGDETQGTKESWAFLDRRIGDVMRLEKAKARVQKLVQRLPDPLGLLGRLRYPRPS